MKNALLKTALLASLTALTACGGSSDGGSNSRPTNPSTPTNPGTVPGAKAPVADMIAFARGGDRQTRETGVVNYSRQAGGVTISADEIPGYGMGLVTRMENGKATVFSVAGEPLVTAATPNGVYTGEVNMNYKMDSAGQWQTAIGNMAIVLDMAEGTASVDSIVGNGNNNIEFMGGAQVANGRIAMNDAIVHVRDGEGWMISRETGTMDGIITTGTDVSAIVGTIGVDNGTNGFEMKGGFSTAWDQRYND